MNFSMKLDYIKKDNFKKLKQKDESPIVFFFFQLQILKHSKTEKIRTENE